MQPNGSGRLDAEITIRRAETIADYRACQEAQRQAWGISEEGYVIPVATMVGANLHGGMVLGAFRRDGQAVGMSFGFLGRVGERICLYSQLTGVVPAYQSRGVGHGLKLVQRYLARAEGLDLIAWAFDPLQAGNAHFNLDRLGPRPARYVGEHVRRADRRPQRRRPDRPPDRRVGSRERARALGRCRIPTLIARLAPPDPDRPRSTGRDRAPGRGVALGGEPRPARDPRADLRTAGGPGRTWPKPGERPSAKRSRQRSPGRSGRRLRPGRTAGGTPLSLPARAPPEARERALPVIIE